MIQTYLVEFINCVLCVIYVDLHFVIVSEQLMPSDGASGLLYTMRNLFYNKK